MQLPLQHTPLATCFQRAVGSDLIVVLSPALDDLPCMFDVHEPVDIQTFVTQPSVEALGKGILHRLAGTYEV